MQPYLYLLCHESDVRTTSSYIIGDYVYLSTPAVIVSDGDARFVEMKEKTTIETKILFPAGPMEASVLKIFMPNNISDSKPDVELYGG